IGAAFRFGVHGAKVRHHCGTFTAAAGMTIETKSAQRCFGGIMGVYAHRSHETKTEMKFAVFTPPGAGPFPALYYLAGLTCTEETFMIKAGAQRRAAELGIMLVAP